VSASEWWGLLGVFAGGALPWLEAIVVIPGGIVAGLPVVPVVAAGMIGNLLTVGVAAFAGDWLKLRLTAWRRRRAVPDDDPEAKARRAATTHKRRARIERLMNRGGLPLLALLGPLGIGTQISAVVAVATGVRPGRAFLWVGAGTVFWCVVVAVATAAGFDAVRG
jgi:hypothetical protein